MLLVQVEELVFQGHFLLLSLSLLIIHSARDMWKQQTILIYPNRSTYLNTNHSHFERLHKSAGKPSACGNPIHKGRSHTRGKRTNGYTQGISKLDPTLISNGNVVLPVSGGDCCVFTSLDTPSYNPLKQTVRKAGRQTDRPADSQTWRQTDRHQGDRQTSRQTDRQAGRQTDKQADSQTGTFSQQTTRPTSPTLMGSRHKKTVF